jgi:hypothetical protein
MRKYAVSALRWEIRISDWNRLMGGAAFDITFDTPVELREL